MGKRPSEHASFLTRQQRRLRNARRWLLGMALRPLLWTLVRIPLPLLRHILRALVGGPVYFANRGAALRHIRKALGPSRADSEYRRIVWTSCLTLGDSLAEAFHAARHGLGSLLERIENLDALDRALAENPARPRGCVAISGHIGNWELLGSVVARATDARRIMVVAKRFPNPYVNRAIERLRSDLMLDTVYQDESPTAAIRSVRHGGIVGIIPDQDVKSISGMFIDFLGQPAFTPVGPARMAITAGVPIYCMFLLRHGDSFRLVVRPPIEADASLSRAEQIASLTRAWSAEVEAVIREHPEQWQWIHNRWKTTPEKLAARGRRQLDVGDSGPVEAD